MAITFDSQSETPTGVPADHEGPVALDLSIVSAHRRAENAEVRLAFEEAQTARMRYEALRLAEVADELAAQVARLETEVEAARAETARMHGVVAATRIDADQAKRDRATLASEVDLLTTGLAEADEELIEARSELVELRAVVEVNQTRSVTERENLDAAIRLAAEFDVLRHDRRVERDAARVDADHNKRLLAAANERIGELEQQMVDDRTREDDRLVELARVAQQEVDDAFAAGSRLGDRAALRSALLEKELVAARQRMKVLASGGCPDPSAHDGLVALPMAEPMAPESALAPPPLGATHATLQERIDALPPAPYTGR